MIIQTRLQEAIIVLTKLKIMWNGVGVFGLSLKMYLLAYNALSFLGWLWVLAMLVQALNEFQPRFNGNEQNSKLAGVFQAVLPSLSVVQSMAVLEVVTFIHIWYVEKHNFD